MHEATGAPVEKKEEMKSTYTSSTVGSKTETLATGPTTEVRLDVTPFRLGSLSDNSLFTT